MMNATKNAQGHAIGQACIQRDRKPSPIPVLMTVMSALIKKLNNKDIQKVITNGRNFAGSFFIKVMTIG
jgi:hypothetical protein